MSNGMMGNYQWMYYVYETPLTMGANGLVYPQACSYELSDDGLTLKLTMIPGKVYSDGTPVTIQDVVASVERAAKYNTRLASDFFDYVENYTVEGDSVTYTFSQYNVTSLLTISDARGPCFIINESQVAALGEDGAITDMADAIGSGVYKLKEYNPDVRIVMERNNLYVDAGNDAEGMAAPKKAYMDTITFSVNLDAASRTAGMIAGDYHFGGIIPEMAPYVEKIGLKKLYLKNMWTPAIYFNLSDANKDSIIQNVDFRKAIRAALDMKAIMLSITLGDTERIILDPEPMGSGSVYYSDVIKNTEWNIANKELAKEYLAKSGYNGETIIWMCAQSASFYTAAIPAIQMLEEIGIKIELKLVDAGSHSTLRNDPSSGYHIGAWEVQKAIENPLRSTMVFSVQGWFEHETKNKLLATLRTQVSGSAESIATYQEYAEFLADNVPWIAFGELLTVRYAVAKLELNYQGVHAYYWNSYFDRSN